MAAFLAFDLGAESGRALLGTVRLGTLDVREVCRFPNTPIRVGDSLRWDFDAIWRAIVDGLSRVADVPLAGIGVDTWGCDYGLIDRDGRLLEPPYHYRDRRTCGVMSRAFDRVGRSRIYATTGIQCLEFNTLYQLCAARARTPEILDAADTLLTMPDLINYRMTGRRASEFTNATTTQCVDARTRNWAIDLVADLDLPTRIFGPIVEPGTVLGALTSEIAGGPAGTSVVAPACHDTGSAVASVDASGDTAFLSSGTWSLLGTEVPAPIITTRGHDLNFTNEGGVGGTTRLLKNIGGLWLLQACRQSWAMQGQHFSYDDLVSAAGESDGAFRTIVDPDDPTFLNPPDMITAIDRVLPAYRSDWSRQSCGVHPHDPRKPRPQVPRRARWPRGSHGHVVPNDPDCRRRRPESPPGAVHRRSDRADCPGRSR